MNNFKNYVNFLEQVQKVTSIDAKKLFALILWIMDDGYRFGGIKLFNIGEQSFVVIYFSCSGSDWRRLSTIVKQHLNQQGFSDLAKRVVIVCKNF